MKRTTSRALRDTLLATALALGLTACSDSPATLMAKAKESLAKSEPRAAEIHLKNLLQNENDPEARYLLGTVYLKAGDLLGAEKEFQRALDDGYDKVKVTPAYAGVLLKLGKAKEVLEKFGAVAPDQGEHTPELLTNIARARLVLGDIGGATATLENVIAADPNYAPAKVTLLAIQAGKGDLAGASAGIDEVLAKHPNLRDALAFKGDLELASQRPREAREYFGRAAAADPQDRDSRAKIAAISLQFKEYDATQKAIDELRKLTGPAPVTMQLQAQAHLEQGKLEPAREAVLAVLKTAPDYLPALALSAQIHLALNSLEMAEQHARRVVDGAPRTTVGYRLLGATYLKGNKPDKALQVLEPALKRGSRDVALHALAGEAALQANEPAKAMAYFEQASKLAPKDSRIVTGLALASLAKGDRNRGIVELEQAVKMDEGAVRADIALVMAHARAREYDKALAAIEKLEKKRPDSPLAPNLRGAILLAQGNPESARKAFELALRRDPKFFAAASSLAQLDLRDNKPDNAKKRYLDLLEKDPKNVQAMLGMASIEQGTHTVELAQKVREEALAGELPNPDAKRSPRGDKEAFEWIKKARETDRTSVPVALALTSWYATNGQHKDAIPILQEMLASNPDNVRLLDALGTAYLRTDQPVQAMETFEKVLRVKPDSADLQLKMGQLKLSRQDTTGAMENFRKAAELEPKSLAPRAALASVHLRMGKAEEARKIATTLQKEQPKSPAGFVLEGDIAMTERKFGDAAGAFRRAIALEKSLETQLKLHKALRASGTTKEADTLLDTLLKAEPGNIQLRIYAGEFEISRKRWASAIEHYEVVIAKQPNNALALNNSAWARYESKDPRALEYAERAAQVAPHSTAVLDTLGVILVNQGEAERGVKILKQAVAYSPKSPQFRLHLAEALIKTGDKAGAGREIDTVLKEFGSGPAAEKAKELQRKL